MALNTISPDSHHLYCSDRNIMDIVLERLEKYAGNLEDIVNTRTNQLMEEKIKTDKLLYRMMPP